MRICFWAERWLGFDEEMGGGKVSYGFGEHICLSFGSCFDGGCVVFGVVSGDNEKDGRRSGRRPSEVSAYVLLLGDLFC